MNGQEDKEKEILVTRSSLPSYEEYIEMIKPIWDSAWLTNMGDFHKQLEKELKITIPETLDYTDLFDDLFARYTAHWKLEQVKTTNMGSLYRLDYRIALRDPAQEKAFLDELRCRNGNLEIVCGRLPLLTEEL